jgi:outer membrane protein assembly factor BamB
MDLTDQWAQWRGPEATGYAPRAQPLTEWGETRNVRWKVDLDGKSHSSPIVVGDLVVIQTAVPVGPEQPPVYDQAPGVHDSVPVTRRFEYRVETRNRTDGRLRWRKVVREAFPHEGGHTTGSPASNSPVSDGERIFAFFGSRGLHAMNLAGDVAWQRDLGRMQTLHAHGEGSSPVLAGDLVIVCWDHEGDSYLFAFDQRNGEPKWKVARDEKTSWSTPLVVEQDGLHQVIVSATKRVRGYDWRTGAAIWECAGLTENVVSSPIYSQGLLIAGNSYYRQAMLAVRLAGASGDVTATEHVVWRLGKMTPYVSSPLLYGNTLYFLQHNQNVLMRLDPATGRARGEPLRLGEIRDFIFSSPVGAAGRIYVTGRDGTTVVLSHSAENEVRAVNHLNDSFSASPALAGTEIYLRGERFLYCLAEKPAGTVPEK